MSLLTHERAVNWVCANLGGDDAGRHNGYHVRDRSGSRVRVAGRHIEGRMPLYFHLGAGVGTDQFDELVVVLFEPDWSVRYAYAVAADALPDLSKVYGNTPPRLLVGDAEAWATDPPEGVVRLDT